MSAIFDSCENSPSLTFDPETIGSFLMKGEQGWPLDFSFDFEEEGRVSIGTSVLRPEGQNCVKRGTNAVCYVRICIDFKVERPGHEDRVLHVEDLYPHHILEVLESDLDENAASRVSDTIHATLMGLDVDDPVGNLVSNCIAPMRLFEPVLNALVAPTPNNTMAQWLSQHINELFCDQEGFMVELEHDAWKVCVQALEVAMKQGLRSCGEVKMVGNIMVADRETGEHQALSKCRTTLLKPSLFWQSQPFPNSKRQDRIATVIRGWKDELAKNIAQQLQEGQTKIKINDVLPSQTLDDRLRNLAC